MPTNNIILAPGFLAAGVATLFLRPAAEAAPWRDLLWVCLLILFFGAAIGFVINGLMYRP